MALRATPSAGQLRDVLVLGTLPTLLALTAVGFTVIERSRIDPTVSAGADGASPVPVFYVPLAVFAVVQGAALVLVRPAAPGRGRAVAAALVAAVLLLLAAPIRVAETVQGLFLVLTSVAVGMVVLWPMLNLFCLALAGGLFGLAVHLPLALAGGGAGGPALPLPGRTPLVLAGIAVAVIFVIAFGVPTAAERMARGHAVIPAAEVDVAWRAAALPIALCCALMTVAGAVTVDRLRGVVAWLMLFALPVGGLALFGGALAGALRDAPALMSLATSPPYAAFAQFVREGRPRADGPLQLGTSTLAIDRSLVLFQLAGNPARRVTTVAFRPTPALLALGVRDRTEPFTPPTVVLNGWRPEPHAREATSAGATCMAAASRPIVECRFPGRDMVAIEIDAAVPSRSFTPQECRLRLGDIGGRAVSAVVLLDCTLRDSWTVRAAAIEAALADLLR